MSPRINRIILIIHLRGNLISMDLMLYPCRFEPIIPVKDQGLSSVGNALGCHPSNLLSYIGYHILDILDTTSTSPRCHGHWLCYYPIRCKNTGRKPFTHPRHCPENLKCWELIVSSVHCLFVLDGFCCFPNYQISKSCYFKPDYITALLNYSQSNVVHCVGC